MPPAAALCPHQISPAEAPVPAAVAGAAAQLPSADLRLAQLLCARVCHDLIGAAGAIETGVDLLAEESADRDDLCDLIGLSGRQLNRRLAFYRLAFGMSGRTSDIRPLAEAKRLAEGFLDGGRVSIRWAATDAAESLSAGESRILLCAILVAAEGLPRGGCLCVRVESVAAGTMLVVEAGGRDAGLAEAARLALAGDVGLEAVTARTVPANYLGLQLKSAAARLDVEQRPGAFAIRIAVPRAQGCA